MSDPCDQTAIAHWHGLYGREHASAEEATKVALALSVEVSEQKARADAAEADARFARLAEKERAKVQESFQAALAAARRECEGLRTILRSMIARHDTEQKHRYGASRCGCLTCAEARAALAAPAAEDSK